MVAEIDIVSGDLLKVSKALKEWDKELRSQLHKDIKAVGKPMEPVIREALEEEYPKRGGLAQQMSQAKILTQWRTGREPGVAWQVRGLQVKLGEVYGMLRHPVYGQKGKTRKEWKWVKQPVKLEGFMQKRVTQMASTLVPEFECVLAQTAEAVLRKVGH